MTGGLFVYVLTAASLCADCFAVSLCSSVTVGNLSCRKVASISGAFAVIQSALLAAGWLFGYLLSGTVMKISHLIGFLLLLWVGGSMIMEGIRNKGECRDLNGLRNIAIGGVATSIDALAVGASMSVDGTPFGSFLPLLIAVFVITGLSVTAGMAGGSAIGGRLGRVAEIAGGCVLTAIGIGFLI